jgi:tetratricopeptide (TPR) repeat protein/DNA-binding CsgD family transcriptional regulator
MQAEDRGGIEANAGTPALAPLLEPFSPLALHVHRTAGPVVGRPGELTAIGQEMSSASSGQLAGVTVEGEPGIGKTRLLLAAIERTKARDFTTIAVTADEELRGPFLLARSIVGSPEAMAAADGTSAGDSLARCLAAMSGQDDPGLASLSPDRKLLRTYDLGAVAIRGLAARRPLALIIDDLQWADDDSLRLLRYIVRADATSPIFLMFAIRPEELAIVTEAVNLLADMERMGLIRRLKLDRFRQAETRELLEQVLGGSVNPASAAAMHAQAEGVPFIVEEMAQAYRDGGLIQEIDRVWSLARNAERLVPSAVRTLISRRAAHLPEDTKASLAQAAVLGRHFSLKDLYEVKLRVSDDQPRFEDLADSLAPAVAAGLLVEHDAASAADYSFPHEQIREFAAAGLTVPRRRAIHAAIVDLLLVGDPSPESLPLLAHHAKAAGDAEVCVNFSIEASRNALEANAPEEVLRVVELALPSAATSQERVGLLEARDRALDMLRRPSDRVEGLAELAALAEALGDSHLELDVRLRRAAALRTAEEEDRAAHLAREVRELAASTGDKQMELAACLELGQDLLRATAGEGYVPPAREVDMDGAEEAYRRAAELAKELGDEASLAAALREVGVIQVGRVRVWFVERVMAGEHMPVVQRVAAGEAIEDILPELPIAPNAKEAFQLFEEALELFDRLGDRRGAMSAIIAMGYLTWAPDIHLGSGAAHHIEEIRRLTSRMSAFTNGTEHAAFEAQMLYGVHVFARAKVIPDLAISRGELAHEKAQEIGDRALEFLSAGGTALAHLDLGEVGEAKRWLDSAAATAIESPTPLRARRLETWRGLACSTDGDVDGMRRHLQRAVELAVEKGQPAARCETLAQLALAAARLGAELGEGELLAVAERSASEAAELARLLPGHPPWGAQAEAALARVALARGRAEDAEEFAKSAIAILRSAMHEDLYLDVVAPVAIVLRSTDAPEWSSLRQYLQLSLAMIAQRTLDEDVRVRWFRGPIGRELTDLAGPLDAMPAPEPNGDGTGPSGEDASLLRSLIQGRTNEEIANEIGIDEQAVVRRLGDLFARIGASSRAEATAFAFRERVV